MSDAFRDSALHYHSHGQPGKIAIHATKPLATQNDLALAYMMLSKDEPAMSNFNQAIALDNSNYNAYYNRGCTYHRLGKYQAAMQDFSQVVKLNPHFTQVYVARAVLRHQRRQATAALSDLNIALKQYQNQGDRQQYDRVVNLKQKLFYSQPNQLV